MKGINAAWSRRGLQAAGLGLLLCGCAQAPVQLPPQVTVVNRTGAAIAEVRYRSCEHPTEVWQSLSEQALPPGKILVTRLPVDCADLSALFEGGRVAGTQTGVKRSFPLTWNIY